MSFRLGLIRLGHHASFRLLPPRKHFASHGRALSRPAGPVILNDSAAHDKNEGFSLALAAACETGDLDGIHQAYRGLAASLGNTNLYISTDRQPLATPPARPVISSDLLGRVLGLLASSGRPGDSQLLRNIFEDTTRLLGVKVTAPLHDAIFSGFLYCGNVREARAWLKSMARRPGNIAPTVQHWHRLMHKALENDITSFRFVHVCLKDMESTGCKPTMESFRILFKARWDKADAEGQTPAPIVFTSLVDEMGNYGMLTILDEAFAAELYESYMQRGKTRFAVQVERHYHLKFPHSPRHYGEVEKGNRWSDMIADAARKRGIEGAVQAFRELQKDGCTAHPYIVSAMLQDSIKTGDIKYLERKLDVKCNFVHWSLIMRNIVRIGDSQYALKHYEAAREAGIIPDAGLVGPLIGSLLQTIIRPPTEADIDRAIATYREFHAAVPITEETTEETRQAKGMSSSGPDSRLYGTLLRALAQSDNHKKYFPVAQSLLDDMRARSVVASDSMTTAAVIVILMRNATTIEEAFDAYSRMREGLDEEGYIVVLGQFCKLSVGEKDYVRSVKKYFDIVNDMRERSLRITSKVYTSLLKQFAHLARRFHSTTQTPPVEGFGQQLISLTRRVHDLLTLDASLSPDQACLNQLLDTYQRLGCFGDCYRVWESMFLTGTYGEVTVSIIFDACGFAGEHRVAHRVYRLLQGQNFTFNMRNWKSWIECLCRLGDLNGALKVVCMEMGKQGMPPDKETVRIVILFAKDWTTRVGVLERIEKFLPELWATLPQSLRTP